MGIIFTEEWGEIQILEDAILSEAQVCVSSKPAAKCADPKALQQSEPHIGAPPESLSQELLDSYRVPPDGSPIIAKGGGVINGTRLTALESLSKNPCHFNTWPGRYTDDHPGEEHLQVDF